MQVIHESGHVFAAWMCRVKVRQVILHPLTISQTVTDETAHSGFVTWMGPLFGMLFPLALWGVSILAGVSRRFLLRFFAGFCLVANGCYLAFGPNEGFTDTAMLLASGTPRWMLVLTGILAAVSGIFLWHKQGADFGIGPNPRPVEYKTIFICWGFLLAVIVFELGI